VKVIIYIEGGGDGQLLDTLFRQGWTQFFQSAGLAGKMPKVVRGKGRRQAFELFAKAVASQRENELPLLLVDSEEAVAQGHTVWQHLKARPGDGWARPRSATNDQAFLMVQVMETWFVADRDALRTFFGNCFNGSKIPAWPNLESVPKQRIYDALHRATAKCREKPYAKGKVSFELLRTILPAKVENASPHAKALLDRLRLL
jgi:Domain of unknown function (DUF4276)